MRFFALAGSVTLGRAVADAMDAQLDPLEEREFHDGEHKSRPLVSVRNEDVYVLHSLAGADGRSAAERLIRLLFFIGACRDNGAARITALVPYLAYQRKDQQTKSRDPVTSRYVAQVLEAVGVDMVATIEAHNPAAFQNAFRCRTLHLDMREAFAARIARSAAGRSFVLVAPDSGGLRRTEALRQTLEPLSGQTVRLAMMEKHRSGDMLTGDLFAGDVEGALAVIVDDLVASGGTLARTAGACRARGAAEVMAVATHALPAPASTSAEITLDCLITSDSVGHPGGGKRIANTLEVVSCARLLGQAIQRLHGGGSINRLLNPRR